MFQGQMRSKFVIQQDVRNAGQILAPGNGDCGDSAGLRQDRVEGDDAFHRPLLKQGWEFGDLVRAIVMADYKTKITLSEELIFNSGHDHRRAWLADLRNDDSDRGTALPAQRSRGEIWAVVKFASRLKNPFLSTGRDGFSSWRVVDNKRNCSYGKVQVLGERLDIHGYEVPRPTTWIESVADGSDTGECFIRDVRLATFFA